MGLLRDIVTTPLSWFYSMGVSIHNTLFDWGIKKSEEFDIPIVCVGNITVGGTGKTPMTEHLVQLLSSYYNVAVLSRGYKRKTKGFILAQPDMSYRRIGDEPKQIKLKFPSIPLAVCEKRTEGIRRLREHHPEINLIILDDGFQHRRVEAWVNIVLVDFNNPFYVDKMLPLGRLRDSTRSLHRAHMFVVTKCPDSMRPIDCRIMLKHIELLPYQSLYFTKMVASEALPLFTELSGEAPLKKKSPVIAISSIANPTGFFENMDRDYQLIDKFAFADHHTYRMSDIAKVEAALEKAPEDTAIIMTEKDAVKLILSRKINEKTRAKMYYKSISVEFLDNGKRNFVRILSQYVAENQKYNITHPE